VSIKQSTDNISGDIVVIGAGGAGLAAAVSAAEHGAKNIIVLEKTNKPGGNSLKIGCFFAVNSPLQKRMGIHVSEETAFHDKIAHCNWRVNARLIRDTIRISGDVVQWLEDKGVIFKRIMKTPFGADTPMVSHDVSVKGQFGATGKAIMDALSADCRKYGIKILVNTRARNITTDGKTFLIAAESENGEAEISAKAVVLSTGGFGGNRDMVEKYFPGYGDLIIGSVPQVTGDGLVMAEGLGAITDDRICLLLLGPFSSVSMGMVTPHIVYVNKEGERYYDESAQFNNYNPDDVANTVIRQRDKISFALFDAKIKELMVQGSPGDMMKVEKDQLEKDFQKAVEEGRAMASDSWEKIAEFIGAKPEVLKATIERYNSFCDYGYDSDFFKVTQYLFELRTPPYYAIKCQPSINTTFGGIKINYRTEVLNKQDIPIAGLYAVGDNAGSWAPATYSHRYPGSAASFAICSGYIAGENAAKYVFK
jgi:fumarate reductase flavoprotein subunit